MLDTLITHITTHTHSTPTGPSSPPITIDQTNFGADKTLLGVLMQ